MKLPSFTLLEDYNVNHLNVRFSWIIKISKPFVKAKFKINRGKKYINSDKSLNREDVPFDNFASFPASPIGITCAVISFTINDEVRVPTLRTHEQLASIRIFGKDLSE